VRSTTARSAAARTLCTGSVRNRDTAGNAVFERAFSRIYESIREGETIAEAGAPGAVTIATNMAGRGVDIKLGGNPEHLAAMRLAREGFESDDPLERERRQNETAMIAKNSDAHRYGSI